MVRELKRRGYPLALIADGPVGTFHHVLTQHNLLDLFDVFAISGELGVEKPHPAIFHYALSRLGIHPPDYRRTVMVGNNLARDIKGANHMGMISVWLDWAPRRPKVPAEPGEVPQFTIREPLELLQLIDELENTLP